MKKAGWTITEQGCDYAWDILEAGGFLPEMTDDPAKDFPLLIAACGFYLEKSVAKGDDRSPQEERDAMVVYLFQSRLEANVPNH